MNDGDTAFVGWLVICFVIFCAFGIGSIEQSND